jgi:hypothetical protein
MDITTSGGQSLNVRFGSKADIKTDRRYVRRSSSGSVAILAAIRRAPSEKDDLDQRRKCVSKYS